MSGPNSHERSSKSPDLPDFEDEEPSRIASLVDIHPTGDVVLLCGSTEQLKLKVSSVVLFMASPVFKAMLKPHFKEGTELATQRSVEVELPEDNPVAMEFLCNAVHMRHGEAGVRGTLTARQVLDVALLCDKYQCVEAVRPIAECWMRHCQPESGNGYLRLLVAAAYHFRHAKAFYELGKAVVKRCARTDYPNDKDVLFEIVDSLDSYREYLYDDIISRVENQIGTLMQQRDSTREYDGLYSCDSNCTFIEVSTAVLLGKLQQQQLWPSHTARSQTIESLVESMYAFECRSTARTNICCGGRCIIHSYLGRELADLRPDADIVAKRINGPCLECYHDDGESGLWGCRHYDEDGR